MTRRSRRIALALVTTVATLAVLEGGAHTLPADWTARRYAVVRAALPYHMMAPSDDVPGWDLAPDGGEQVEVPYHTNRWMMRGPDFGASGTEARKDDHVVRAIFVGDSGIFGHGLAWEHTIPAQFETLQERARPGVDYQVAACACPGHSTLQSIVKLERHCLDFGPDLVIIGNLYSDSTDEQVSDQGRFAVQRSPLARSLDDHSALYRLIRNVHLRHRVLAKIPAPEVIAQVGHPRGSEVRVSLDAYRSNLTELVRLSHEADAQAVLLALPGQADVNPEMTDSPYREYRRVMGEVAADLRVPLVNAPVAFQRMASRENLFLDPIHLAPRGAKRTAREIVRTLSGGASKTQAPQGK